MFGELDLRLKFISRINQLSDVAVLQLRKIFENFGLSLAIPRDCSYNVRPQAAIVSVLSRPSAFRKGRKFQGRNGLDDRDQTRARFAH